jgi:hypothetical protein
MLLGKLSCTWQIWAYALTTLDVLNVKRAQIAQKMMLIMMSPIAEANKIPQPSCQDVHMHIGSCLNNLHYHGITPYSESFMQLSFEGVLNSYLALAVGDIPNSRCMSSTCLRERICWEPPLKTSGAKLSALLRSDEGLCLDCLKSGGGAKVEETCRVQHGRHSSSALREASDAVAKLRT